MIYLEIYWYYCNFDIEEKQFLLIAIDSIVSEQLRGTTYIWVMATLRSDVRTCTYMNTRRSVHIITNIYTVWCSLPENILSLKPTSNALTPKYIHFIQSTFIFVDTQPFARKAFHSANRRPITPFYYASGIIKFQSSVTWQSSRAKNLLEHSNFS